MCCNCGLHTYRVQLSQVPQENLDANVYDIERRAQHISWARLHSTFASTAPTLLHRRSRKRGSLAEITITDMINAQGTAITVRRYFPNPV